MINNIKIRGYKSIKKLNLNLSGINILIGANGAGKSNFVSFFKLVNDIYEQRLERSSLKKGSESLLHFGNKLTKSIFGRLEFNKTNAYTFQLSPNDNGGLFLNFEKADFNSEKGSLFVYKDTWFDNTISYNSKESRLKNSHSKTARYVNSYLRSFKIYHFHDTSDSSNLRTPSPINDNIILHGNGDNLPSFLYLLQEKHLKHFRRIEQMIKSIASYFERFELQPDRLNNERINLEWREINHPDVPFNARHFSDGTLRFIALTTLLMQPNLPEVIIIDEPELGLHPVAINKLSGLIKKASARSQIIISTQSVNLVNHFSAEDIITVDRIENQSVFKKPDKDSLKNWLDDFSLGELWLKNMIKGQPY